jgi:arginyl-tRNA synthetase
MVEYLAPNTNKPLHIGHLRNGVIGTSVANLLRVSGANVVRANNINDRGIHITQSMFAYKMWSHGETPTTAGEKGDHFVGRYYVMFHQEVAKQYLEWLTAKGISPDQLADKDKKKMRKEFERQCPLIQRAYEMLSRWEAEDPETVSQWKQMNNWVYEGFEQTNARIGFNFERVYYESRTYKLGKDIVLKQADEGFGQKVADGSIAIDLSDVKLGKDPVTLLRADGTSVYITQDIGLAVTRFNEIPQLSGVTYVVAREQEFHFKCLFEILRRYGYPWYGQLFHLSYGMVNLASGKMKSREGTVVDADDLMNDLHGIVAEIIKRNEPEATQQEIGRRAEAVALGALKYMLASTSPNNDILFKPEESVKFEGNTGPYLQYACVRIAAIEAKARDLPLQNSEEVADPEFELIKELNLYPKAVQEAADAYDPSIVASYLYDLAKRFSVFYTECQVVYDGKVNASRLAICKTTKQVLSNGLELLGIPVPDRM